MKRHVGKNPENRNNVFFAKYLCLISMYLYTLSQIGDIFCHNYYFWHDFLETETTKILDETITIEMD